MTHKVVNGSATLFGSSAYPNASEAPSVELSVFVACYNEELNIYSTLETVVAAMRDVRCSFEIIVIDDASTDRSVERIEAFQAAHGEAPIIVVRNRQNRGLARNFVAAAFLARGTHFKLVCGDNALPRLRLFLHGAEGAFGKP